MKGTSRKSKHNKPGRCFLFRVPENSDLLAFLTDFCRRNQVEWGAVWAIGAVKRAAIGFYDQKGRGYRKTLIKRHLEIVSCMGNVSLKDGRPMVHCHISLGDSKGRLLGGHLFEGTAVFVCEALVMELSGPKRLRIFDPGTGLALWNI